MKKSTKNLCQGAVLVAMALALSYLKIPVGAVWGSFGGSIDFVMVPLIIFAVKAGWGWGIGAGFIFGLLKFFFAGGAALNWESLLLDYSVAYGAVGLAGLAKGSKWELMTGAVIGCLARFGVHFVSGITVYAQYMPETFMDMTMLNTFHYSLLYNGTYMLPNTVIAVAACVLLAKPMKRFMEK